MESVPPRHNSWRMDFLGIGIDIGIVGPAFVGLAATAVALRRLARYDRD
jgi:hypothetical protein